MEPDGDGRGRGASMGDTPGGNFLEARLSWETKEPQDSQLVQILNCPWPPIVFDP